jgi:hypothetical protein
MPPQGHTANLNLVLMLSLRYVSIMLVLNLQFRVCHLVASWYNACIDVYVRLLAVADQD